MPTRTPVLFPALRGPVRNARAIERTIRSLERAGRLEDVDAALVAALRSTARMLDEAPNPYVGATVARVHLVGLQLLAGRPAAEPDELDAFLASLRTPTLGNAPQS